MKKAGVKAPVEAAAEAKLIAEAADAAVSGHGASISGLGVQSVAAEGEGGSSGGMGSTALILGGIALAGGVAAAAAGGGNDDTTYVPVPTPTPPPPAPTYAVSAVSPISGAAITSVDEGATVRFVVEVKNPTQPNQTYKLEGISADDLVDPSQISGGVTIGSDGKGYVDIAIKADKLTEGAEKIKITVGSASAEITVNDKSTSVVNQTFTLTPLADITGQLVGDKGVTTNDGDDTFVAQAATLGAFDVLAGGLGADTLNVYVGAAGEILPTTTSIKGIETVNIFNNGDGVTGYDNLASGSATFSTVGTVADTIDAARFENATAIWQHYAANDVYNLGAGVAAGFASISPASSVGTNNALANTLTAAAGVSTINIAFKDVVSKVDGYAGYIDVAGADLSTVIITGNLLLPTDATAKVAQFALDINPGAAVKALAVKTSVLTEVDFAAGSLVTSVDASASTGGIIFNSSTATKYIAVSSLKTGSGDDKVMINTVTAKDDVNTAVDETVNASVMTNDGSDEITIVTSGSGTTTASAGAGDDTVIITSRSTGVLTVDLGAGDDAFNITASGSASLAKTDVISGGDGVDTLNMNAVDAVTATASGSVTVETAISGFERLSIGVYGSGSDTIDLGNLDDIQYVIVGGASGAGTHTISGFSNNGTLDLRGILGASGNLTVADTAFSAGTNDTFNLNAKGNASGGFTNSGALSISKVENLNITLDDTSTLGGGLFDLNIDAVDAKKVTVSGDGGITFDNSSLTAITTLDASGVTAGAVTFSYAGSGDLTITGGAGADQLTGGTGKDVITGGAGNDILLGGAGNDTLSGGEGGDILTGGDGLDILTGGSGLDTFAFDLNYVSGSASVDSSVDPLKSDVIKDFNKAEDTISLTTVSSGSFTIAANVDVAGKSSTAGTNTGTNVEVALGGKVTFAATDDTLAEKLIAVAADDTDVADGKVVFFEDAGNTYIYVAASSAAASSLIVLEGKTGFTSLTEVASFGGAASSTSGLFTFG